MDCFFIFLTFWTTLAPHVLFLQILLENLFKVFLQIVKGIWIRFREAFSRFEIFSPCFKCFSFDLTKLPLNQMFLLVFKRVLPILQIPNWVRSNTFRYQFWNNSWKFFFEIDGGAVLLLWANILSSFGIHCQKRSLLRALITISSIGK